MLVRVMRFRPGLLAVVLPCLLLALAPGSAAAQSGDNAGECVESASQGTVKKYRCRLGPVTVGPFQVLTKELIFGIPKPALDGFVTDMSVDVVDTNGQPMPISRLMLHHIVFGNLGRLDRLEDRSHLQRPWFPELGHEGLPSRGSRALLRGGRGAREDEAAARLRLSDREPGLLVHDLHVHESPLEDGHGIRRVRAHRRHARGPRARGPVLARRGELQDRPGLRRAGRQAQGRHEREADELDGPRGGPAGRGGRSRARRRQGARPRPSRVPQRTRGRSTRRGRSGARPATPSTT